MSGVHKKRCHQWTYRFLAELTHSTIAVRTVDPGLPDHVRINYKTAVTARLQNHLFTVFF